MDLEINEKFKEALELLENTNSHIFLTGEAGTGKSTLLKHFRETTEKNIVVLAPTGVAAVNIDGETIHSFFGFKPDITLDNLEETLKKVSFQKRQIFNQLDAIVIDEISMVRADMLDIINNYLNHIVKKKNSNEDGTKIFGGLQMIFIGDLFQLPPVVKRDEKAIFSELYESAFFFSSNILKENIDKLEVVQLNKIYRQKDISFVNILNNIRKGKVIAEELSSINKQTGLEFPKDAIYLTTTNATAEDINTNNLKNLDSEEKIFKANIIGNISSDNFPAEQNMVLKVKARVMLVNNDSDSRWINGTLGYIKEIEEKNIKIKLDSGTIVDVSPYSWEVHKTSYDLITKKITKELMGSFTQFPLKLAWAITIHKSQGKTFDQVIIDLGYGAFAEGQVYVALSRATSLEGIFLKKEIQPKDIIVDRSVLAFFKNKNKLSQVEPNSNSEHLENLEDVINKQGWCKIYLKRKGEENFFDIVRPFDIKEIMFNGSQYKTISVYSKNFKLIKTYFVNNIISIEEVET